MTSIPKRGPRTSPTTIILVLVLLGAVAGASRLVTGPPRAPKPAKPEGPTPEQMKMLSKMTPKQRMEMMGGGRLHPPPSKVKPVTDPNGVDEDSDYFMTHKPGEAGLKQVDKELPAMKAAYSRYLKEKEAELRHTSPSGSAQSTPSSSALKSAGQ